MNRYSDSEFENDLSKALETRAHRQALIEQWEAECVSEERAVRPGRVLRRPVWCPVSLAAAACAAAACAAAAFFLLRPMTQSPSFNMPDFTATSCYARSAGDGCASLDRLIAGGDYAASLTMADSLVIELENEIKAYGTAPLSDRDAYRRDLASYELYEVRWRRVNLLFGLKRNDEALKELSSFRTLDGSHKAEADSLFNLMK